MGSLSKMKTWQKQIVGKHRTRIAADEVITIQIRVYELAGSSRCCCPSASPYKTYVQMLLEKKDSRTLFAQLQDAWGGGALLREETGILTGKIQGSREVEDTSCTGQGLHGWIPGGTREEDIPWPSTYQRPPLPNLLHESDSQVGRVGMSWLIVIMLRGRERWNLCPGQAGPMTFYLKWAAMGRWSKSYSHLTSLGGKGCTHGK